MRERNSVKERYMEANIEANNENVIVVDFVSPLEIQEKIIYTIIKRSFDLIFATICLIFLSPIFIIVAILIRSESKGKIIFKQERVGRDGNLFEMYKFRSMYIDAEERLKEIQHMNMMSGPVFKVKNDPRITNVGRIIRKMSIDELPQFLNIIKGDMSVVGPRPPLLREVEQYSEYQRNRLRVKPGLTCYWQVSGRNTLSFSEWIELDIRYIRERSLWTDIKIIFMTIPAVLTGSGAY